MKEKSLTLINLIGMSLAVACCVLVAYYLQGEFTYDRHHELHDRIYRVGNNLTFNNVLRTAPTSQRPLGPLLLQDYPAVQASVRFEPLPETAALFSYNQAEYYEDRVFWVDPNVFEIFTFDILQGDPETALAEPGSIAISESFARKYFGDEPALGKILESNLTNYQVSLVYQDLPPNSHLKHDALVTYSRFNMPQDTSSLFVRESLWYGYPPTYTYLLLPENYDVDRFQDISDSFYDRYMADLGVTFEASWSFFLEPLADIHLQSTVDGDLPRGNLFYIYGLIAAALFVLLTACVNHVNLFMAQAGKRAKEFGMRRILGASKTLLRVQLIFESVIMTLIAVIIGFILVFLTAEPFGGLLNSTIETDQINSLSIYLLLLLFSIVLGVASGIFPAIVLSNISTLESLRQHVQAKPSKTRLRAVLLFFQFAVSTVVIACAVLLLQQLNYLNIKSLGFDANNKLVVRLHGTQAIMNADVLLSELSTVPGVNGTSVVNHVLGENIENFDARQIEDNFGEFNPQYIYEVRADENTLDALGINLLMGRNFDPDFGSDLELAVLVNQATVRKMGWTEPLGKQIDVFEHGFARVVGVMEDFHFQDLSREIEPLLFQLDSLQYDSVTSPQFQEFFSSLLLIDIADSEVSNVLAYLNNNWSDFDSQHPLTYWFLEDSLGALYLQERQQASLILAFAMICIFISCIGLFALTALSVTQRTKELGVRAILGAGPANILGMLFKDIMWIVLFSSLLAAGIAYGVISIWIRGYYYHDDVSLLLLLLSVALTMGLAYVTVMLQFFGLAKTNPVNSLRCE